jgi:hypothetical protein
MLVKKRAAKRLVGLVICVFAVLTISAGIASAERRVFLNGVDLGDVELKARLFSNAEVRFDKQGNVHIEVKGLKVEKRDADTSKKKPPTKRYYLVSTHPGTKTGPDYDIEVLINGARAATLKPLQGTQATEVTRYMQGGKNVVKFRSAGTVSTKKSEAGAWEITLGAGRVKKGSITLTSSLVDFRRTAAETGEVRATYRIRVK